MYLGEEKKTHIIKIYAETYKSPKSQYDPQTLPCAVPGVKNVISINFSSAMTSSGTAQQLKSEIERTLDLDF